MEVTKETIEEIISLAEGKPIDVSNVKYTTHPIYRVNEPVAKPLKGFSLGAVVNYLKGNPDNLKSCLVEINSQCVSITSPLNEDMERSVYFVCEPQVPYIHYVISIT